MKFPPTPTRSHGSGGEVRRSVYPMELILDNDNRGDCLEPKVRIIPVCSAYPLSMPGSEAMDRTASIRRAVLLFLVVLVPVAFVKGPLFETFNVPKLALLVAGVGAAGALRLFELLTLRSRPSFAGLWVPVVAICLPLTLSWAASPYKQWALLGQYPRFQGLLPYLIFGAFGLLVVDAFGRTSLSLAWALVVGGGISGAYALLQSLSLDPLTWYVGGAPYPITSSTGGHPNYTGGFLAIALPVAVYLWVCAPRGRRFAALATVLIGGGLVTSLSQGPWGAGLGGVVVLVGAFLAPQRRWVRKATAIVTVALAATMIIPVVVGTLLPQDRGGVFGGTSRSRGNFWRASFQLAAESPILGRGPNSFAVDGVRYRPLEDALRNGHDFTDDPHSVPLSFLANSGLVGFGGFGLLIAWVVVRIRRLPSEDLLGHAFGAACVAYLLQALVGIDEPIQRIAAWTVLAGLASRPIAEPISPSLPSEQSSLFLKVAAGATSLAIATTAIYWSARFVLADRDVAIASEFFEEGKLGAAQGHFEAALRFRDEYEFRETYSQLLGLAALREGAGGADLIDKMGLINSYLSEFPESTAIATEAELLHYWGHFDPRGDARALSRYERLLELDPENPLVETQMGEVLLDLDMATAAVELLKPLAAGLPGRASDLWAILSIAYARNGRMSDALAALDVARAADPGTSCRRMIAESLIAGDSGKEPPLALSFICSRGLYQWYQDQSDKQPS